MNRSLLLVASLLVAGLATAEPNEAYRPERAARVAMLRGLQLFDIVSTPIPTSGASAGGTTFAGGAITSNLDFDATGATLSHLGLNTVQTPDALVMSLGTTSRNFLLVESGDEAFDFAHAQSATPTLFVHSAAQSTTQWISLAHNGTTGDITTATAVDMRIMPGSGSAYFAQGLASTNLFFGNTVGNHVSSSAGRMTFAAGLAGTTAGLQLLTVDATAYRQEDLTAGTFKTLTESAATAFVTINVASGAAGSAGGVVFYTIEADDGTDFQARSGSIPWAAINKAGTETCTVGAPVVATTSTEVVAVSSGTLTNTFTCETTPTNGITISANAVSSLTQTTLQIIYRVIKTGGTGTIVPQ